MFKTILFPIDQSREAREAAHMVADLVKNYQSHLILLSVVEEVTESDPHHANAMNSPEDVAKLLQAGRDFFSQKGIEAQVLEKEGIPSFSICDVADEMGADLIVMGCRGLGLTSEGAAESVTSQVINLSPCPVLIVP